MNHLFATYELSLLAKEKGFKDFCFAGYVEINTKEFQFMMNSQIDSIDEAFGLGDNLITKAPLYQQLVDWFREKHKTIIVVDFYNNGDEWEETEFLIKIAEFKHFKTHDSFVKYKFKSYYEALNKGIEEAFKLI